MDRISARTIGAARLGYFGLFDCLDTCKSRKEEVS
jgi:hypothetical protein